MFKVYSNLEAVEAINSLEIEKFSTIVKKCLENMQTTEYNKLLNSSELQLLQKDIDFSDVNQLQNGFYGVSQIFDQAAFANIDPESLYTALLERGIAKAHGKVIGKVWAAESFNIIAKLQTHTLGNAELINTSHSLNVTLGTSELSRMHDTTAILEFQTSSGNEELNISSSSSSSSSSIKDDGSLKDAKNNKEIIQAKKEIYCSSSKSLVIEFSHDELHDFLIQLDRIQLQLDRL